MNPRFRRRTLFAAPPSWTIEWSGRRLRHGIHAVALGLLLIMPTASAHGGPLYQCRDSSDTLVFTDSPAQLDRCASVQSAPMPVTAAGYSPPPYSTVQPPTGFPRTSETDWPPPPAMPPTETHTPGGPQDIFLRSIPTPQASTAPCHPGLNPLNQFGAPPCHLQEEQTPTVQHNAPMPAIDSSSPVP